VPSRALQTGSSETDSATIATPIRSLTTSRTPTVGCAEIAAPIVMATDSDPGPTVSGNVSG